MKIEGRNAVREAILSGKISNYSDLEEFYQTAKENQHTVFFANKNGSLRACRNTQYAIDFHKELKKRKKNRRKSYKRKMSDAANRELMSENEE